jgi:CubicO group peptidase (beta-lactamase class C family)
MPEIDQLELRARIGRILNRWPTVGMALGVVRNGRLEFFHEHGFADIASNTPVTEDTVFRIGSSTKTFTAIAVMQLFEQGLVDLDAAANDYLRAYRLIPAKTTHRPATLRHLLTHTAGLPEVVYPSRMLQPVFGEMIKLGKPVPSLAEYYRGALRLVAEPGTRYIYSDHAFATLSQIVEDVTGKPFDRYIHEQIFEPLGTSDTDLLRSDRVKTRLATGYQLGSGGAKPVTDAEVITAGGGGIYSTPNDMARYLAALLGGGANERGSVLKPESLATMYAPHYEPDPRLPGIGLAFSRFNLAGHLAVEHGGIIPGFNSQIFAAPDNGVAVMAFTTGARNAMLWLPGEVGGLLRQLLSVFVERIRSDIPHQPKIWGDICGWYRLDAGFTDARARLTIGAGAEVWVRGGQLMLRGLSPVPAVYRAFPLHPDDNDDPYVFRIDLSEFGIDTGRIVFSQQPGKGTTALHIDFFPPSLQRRPATTNPRRWVTGALGALAVAITATAVRRRNRQ